MLNFKRVIFSLCLIAITSNVTAGSLQGKYNWSIGMDVKYLYAKPANDFARILNSKKTGMSIFLGYRSESVFGYELGFSWTDPKTRAFYAPTGTRAFGATSTQNTTHNGRFKLKDSYLDFHGNFKLTQYIEAKMLLGIGFVRQKFKFFHSPSTGDVMSTTLDQIRGRTSPTIRFGIGAQTMIHERVGLRFMFNYQTLSNIRVRGLAANVNPKILNNSYSASLGAFWTFTGHRKDRQLL